MYGLVSSINMLKFDLYVFLLCSGVQGVLRFLFSELKVHVLRDIVLLDLKSERQLVASVIKCFEFDCEECDQTLQVHDEVLYECMHCTVTADDVV